MQVPSPVEPGMLEGYVLDSPPAGTPISLLVNAGNGFIALVSGDLYVFARDAAGQLRDLTVAEVDAVQLTVTPWQAVPLGLRVAGAGVEGV